MALRNYALTSIALFALATPTQAQERAEGFSVGVGLTHPSSIFAGEDGTMQVFPLLRYDTDAFSVGIPEGLRVTVFSDQDLRLGAVIAPRLSALSDVESAELAGIDRDLTFDGGASVRYLYRRGTQLRLRAVTELSDEHGGQEISAELRQPIPLGRIPLLASAGLTWMSDDLAQYSYGVLASEALAGRLEYAPGDVIIPHVSVSSVFPISDNLNLVGSVRAEVLPDEVTNSPIVDEDIGVNTFLGLTYQF